MKKHGAPLNLNTNSPDYEPTITPRRERLAGCRAKIAPPK